MVEDINSELIEWLRKTSRNSRFLFAILARDYDFINAMNPQQAETYLVEQVSEYTH